MRQKLEPTRLDGSLATPAGMLLAAAKPAKWRILALMAAFVLSAPLGVAEPWLVAQAVDRVMVPAFHGGWAAERIFVALTPWVAGVAAAACLGALLDGVAALALKSLGQRLVASLRDRLCGHVLALDVGFFDAQPSGRVANRITADVEAIAEVYTGVMVPMVKDIALLVAVVVVIVWMDVALAATALLVIPLALVISLGFRQRLRTRWRALREAQGEVVALGAEQLSAARTLRLAGREDVELKAFGVRNDGALQSAIQTLQAMAMYRPLIQGVGDFGLLALLVVGAWRVGIGALSLGELTAFVPYQQRLLGPVQALSDRLNVMQAGLAAAERVAGYLAKEAKLLPPPSTASAPDLSSWPADRPLLEFEEVWFAYADEAWVLRGVSFAIHPGESLGVVGRTGAGKSTILALAARLHDPQRGCIRLGGVDLREWPLDALRRAVGLVIQEGGLFAGTVAFNLDLGLAHARAQAPLVAQAMGEAAWWAQEGASAAVLEGGATLSAGQAQLLALGRALAQAPPILALDEATAAIDPSTEARLQRALQQAAKGKAWLVVAHRLATVRDADQIVVLEGGMVCERGRHQELLALRGRYAGWWAEALAAGQSGQSSLPATEAVGIQQA